jgi:PAS domain S-box-containing protein
MFETSYQLGVYGRQWDFQAQTTRLFESFNASKQPALILFGGLTIDALILLVFGLMANARRRAEDEVARKTLELQESLDFINRLADNLPLAVSVWGADMTCRFMNAHGGHWFPFSEQEAIGKHLKDILGPEIFEQRRDYYRRVLEGDSVQAQGAFPNQQGELRDVLVSYYPLRMSGEPCFMATTMDVSEIVQREKELELLNKELEKQKHDAESAVVVKTAFLANMSHEIRTPMNAIIGVLVLLQEAGLEEKPRRLVKKAFSASEALLQLLNDILDLSKIEADYLEIDPHPFDVESLIHRSVDLFTIVAEEKGLKLKVHVAPHTPARLIGDLLRISQVCTNLMGNAVKFTAKGRIDVRIGFQAISSARGTLIFEVADTGEGIKPEDQARIFENFRQADESTGRHFGGTGLGLAISRRLVDLMDGDLTVVSTFGEGATFRLMVPVDIAKDDGAVQSRNVLGPVQVYHYGFGENLALLEEYGEHWRFVLEPLQNLTSVVDILNRARSPGHEEDAFIAIDLDKTEKNTLIALIRKLRDTRELAPLRAVLVIAPAGCTDPWVGDLLNLGGRITYEPLTPSRLWEHFSQHHGRSMERVGAPKPQFKDLSVLVVDDVPLNCEIVESYLRSFGVSAESVLSGKDALARLDKKTFDLILMDLHLNGETGQELASQILTREHKQVPIIIALSASIADRDRISAKDAGMLDYLTKPVIPKDIQLLLETYFEDRKVVIDKSDAVSAPIQESEHLPDFISRESYQQLFGEDSTLFDRCVRSFVASAPGLLLELNDAEGPPAIRSVAHKVRGAAANISDVGLASLAANVEQAPDDRSVMSLVDAMAGMLLEHSATLEKRLRPTLVASENRPGATIVKTARMRASERMRGNRIANDQDLEIILADLMAQGLTEQASMLRRALEIYDFSGALDILTEDSPKGGTS